MMEYYDHNEHWMHNPQMQDDIDPDDAMKSGCFVLTFYAVAFIVFMVIMLLLSSCTTTRVVTVPEIHDHWHHTIDTIKQTDSVTIERQTTIMQLDSVAMAKYGIQLKAAEQAWLIRTQELEQQLKMLMNVHHDTLIEHDSIPYPVEVVKEVERPLTKTELGLILVGIISIMILVISIVLKVKRYLPH